MAIIRFGVLCRHIQSVEFTQAFTLRNMIRCKDVQAEYSNITSCATYVLLDDICSNASIFTVSVSISKCEIDESVYYMSHSQTYTEYMYRDNTVYA